MTGSSRNCLGMRTLMRVVVGLTEELEALILEIAVAQTPIQHL
jgi:hypothetical protein